MNRKKSIFLSLAIIGVAATMITAATSAVFTDQVVSESNELTAGTLFMSVDNDCGPGDAGTARDSGGDGTSGTPCSTTTTSFNVTNMTPGQAVTNIFDIVNEGTLAGTLTGTAVLANEVPTGCFSVTAGGTLASTPLAVAATVQHTVTVTLLETVDNDCQAAAADVVVTFDLAQLDVTP
jgi:predicted ribosomally synthesized peptide with SipW-like signal peptide